MLQSEKFIEFLKSEKVSRYTGVPDSLLKLFIQALEHSTAIYHHPVGNEGSAIALAIGDYISTSEITCVYMQNSGLGNAINPLVSLAHEKIYKVPMLLIIGWRGELDEQQNQLQDEPQHIFQGEITLELLRVLEIPYQIIGPETNSFDCVRKLLELAKDDRKPVCLVVRHNTFTYQGKTKSEVLGFSDHLFNRDEFLSEILKLDRENLLYISSTGFIGREFLKLRHLRGDSTERDLMIVGGMGHASTIAYAISKKLLGDSRLICLDGDGALLMHMGSIFSMPNRSRLIHIIFNNGGHESVGGQKTGLASTNLSELARIAGYERSFKTAQPKDFHSIFEECLSFTSSTFIEIICRNNPNKKLPRPESSPAQALQKFTSNFNRIKSESI
jgi:phosphonopyruvate decarboxylase